MNNSRKLPYAFMLWSVAILSGVGGFYYYQMQRKTENQALPVTTVSPSSTIPATASSSPSQSPKKKSENNKAFLVGFDYPDSPEWALTTTPVGDGDGPYVDGDRAYMSVNYNGCGSSCGLAYSIRVVAKDSVSDNGASGIESLYAANKVYSQTAKTDVTFGGAKGTRYVFTPNDTTVAPIVNYYFQHKDFSYYMTVNYNGAKTDKLDLVGEGEKIVNSLRFL
jgi:hypothetical protein